MVRYSIFIAVFLLVVVPSYTKARAYNEGYDGLDRFNDVGSPATHNEADECRKDMLLILDTSRSITRNSFDNHVKPFLLNLINDPSLNVNPSGTQLALMIFSTKVKMVVKFGEATTIEALTTKLNKELIWDEIKGGHTRTDLALKEASDQILPHHSPDNYRPIVEDVVVLITDGNPRGRSDEKDPEIALRYAGEIKGKEILIVCAAVGPDRNDFTGFLQGVATLPAYVVDAAFDNMNTIRATLIASSCIKSGKFDCKCPDITTTKYVESDDMKTRVSWPVPEAECSESSEEITMTNAEYPRPSGEFGVGTKTITYSDLSEKTEDTCDVVINVEVCKCMDVGEVKAPLLKPGESKVKVSWKIPRPGCIQKDDNKDTDSALLPYGTTIKKYHYTHGQSKFTCPVKIVVDAILCGGKKYDPTKNECCCGTVHKKKDSHECCGPEYIDINSKQCCPGYNVHLSGSKCPGE